jgi:hypothetical protein
MRLRGGMVDLMAAPRSLQVTKRSAALLPCAPTATLWHNLLRSDVRALPGCSGGVPAACTGETAIRTPCSGAEQLGADRNREQDRSAARCQDLGSRAREW